MIWNSSRLRHNLSPTKTGFLHLLQNPFLGVHTGFRDNWVRQRAVRPVSFNELEKDFTASINIQFSFVVPLEHGIQRRLGCSKAVQLMGGQRQQNFTNTTKKQNMGAACNSESPEGPNAWNRFQIINNHLVKRLRTREQKTKQQPHKSGFSFPMTGRMLWWNLCLDK